MAERWPPRELPLHHPTFSHQKAATGVNGDGLRFVAVRLTVNQRQLHTWTRRNRQPYGVITRRRTK
jgi:hypothetical protein